MNLKPEKLILGALLAGSLGLATVPAHASSYSSASAPRADSGTNAANIVVAGGVGDKAQGKVNEMHEMGSGAADAVEEKHEEHEAAESTEHHTSLKHKAKSKMHEAKGEAEGAGDAIENAHERHEESEHE